MLINRPFFAPIRYFPAAFILFFPFPASASGFTLNAGALPDPAAYGFEPPELKAPAAPVVKEWTLMIFVNGKNNLEEYAMLDVNQMELAGSTDRVNIAVELGRMNGQQEGDDASEGGWTGARRYLIVKDNDTARISSPVLDYRGKADMGSWKELADFVKWSRTRFPARRYGLILWDHGYGWKPLDMANAPDFANTKGFSLDEETGHEISLIQIRAALEAAGGVNFLMLDGCNMQMASVAYELKDNAEALVASEEMEPGVVLRYAKLVGMLGEKPQSGAEELAVNAVRIYRDYFTGGGGDTEETRLTQSAVRLKKLPALRAKLDAWAALAMKAERDTLAFAKEVAKSYDDPEFKDLYHLVSLVTGRTQDARLRSAGGDVLKFIKNELVLENWAQDRDSHGLSVYVPDVYDPLYGLLAWSKDGVWDDFAKLLATFPPSEPAKPRTPRR